MVQHVAAWIAPFPFTSPLSFYPLCARELVVIIITHYPIPTHYIIFLSIIPLHPSRAHFYRGSFTGTIVIAFFILRKFMTVYKYSLIKHVLHEFKMSSFCLVFSECVENTI